MQGNHAWLLETILLHSCTKPEASIYNICFCTLVGNYGIILQIDGKA